MAKANHTPRNLECGIRAMTLRIWVYAHLDVYKCIIRCNGELFARFDRHARALISIELIQGIDGKSSCCMSHMTVLSNDDAFNDPAAASWDVPNALKGSKPPCRRGCGVQARTFYDIVPNVWNFQRNDPTEQSKK